jgi:hypothetical protein
MSKFDEEGKRKQEALEALLRKAAETVQKKERELESRRKSNGNSN